MKPTLILRVSVLLTALAGLQAAENGVKPDRSTEETALNFHLMHPGGESSPGDPNAAFYLDGVYHLHYILTHPWQKSCLTG